MIATDSTRCQYFYPAGLIMAFGIRPIQRKIQEVNPPESRELYGDRELYLL